MSGCFLLEDFIKLLIAAQSSLDVGRCRSQHTDFNAMILQKVDVRMICKWNTLLAVYNIRNTVFIKSFLIHEVTGSTFKVSESSTNYVTKMPINAISNMYGNSV